MAVWQLTQRSLIRYWRDKGALLFSLLSVFIIIALNVFFLADMQIKSIEASMPNAADAEGFIYAFIFGGLICIPAVNVPLMLLTFKVNDAADNIQDDLLVSPANRISIMLGYIFAAWIAGFVMTMLTFVLGEIFIVSNGGQLVSLASGLKIVGITALTILAFSGFSFFMIMRIKSNSALAVINTIFNTLIGFFAGLYVPLGNFSAGVANIIKAFPLSHAAALLRQILTEGTVSQAFARLPAATTSQLRQNYGVDIVLGGHVFQSFELLLILTGFGLFLYVISAAVLMKSKRKA